MEVTEISKEKFNGVYILGIDAKDIYLSNHYLNTPDKTGYRIRGTNGTISTRKFVNTLDYSLDLIKLREIYEKVYRRINFGWNVGDKEYTQYVINVTFKYSVKAYNRIRKGLYIKNGWSPHEIALTDCADVRNGELVAIQIDADVDEPICDDLLGNYFWFCDGQYHVKQNVKTEVGVAALRKDLYENGFYCDGIHYVRFKRSSGSSRVGKCLFIDEKLYRGMDKWAHCGIKIKDGQEIDLAAWEAYIALTTSSIIDTIEINPENILVINDFESVFSDDVIATRIDDNGRLISKPEQVEIKNSIWDGQSLLDSELFTGYDRYGMLLLRNRFFKSACFNTNIQWFFRQKGITSVSQLNGYTIAKRIEDIKLITTPSSIKYLKFGSLQQWLDNLDPIFGIVKHEKPTHYFDGRLVQTHYQLINSLQLTYEEMEEFLKPSIDYIHLLNTEPAVIRNHIRYPSKDDWHLPMTALESKNDIVYKLLGLNERFCETKLYSEFRRDLVRSFVKNLKCGHVLVNGNYSTLLGNPLEMLYNAIGSWNGESMLGIGNVCSTRFCDGQELLGSRSPHVTMGNILLTKNVRNEEIYKYFNLSDEVIAINSINENILSKLNGSDFDSDTMLVTDDKVLIEAARRNYNKFLVPTSLISSKKTKRQYTNSEKADLDVKTAVNKIGEIINLSQEINTLIWDMLNSGTAFDEILPLYCDVAQLDVMSGIEIDRAKKEFVVDNTLELKYLKEKYNRRDDNGRLIKPNFFGHISRQKGYYNPQKKNYQRHNTAMDYLQAVIATHCKRFRSADLLMPFSYILNDYQYIPRIINLNQVNRIIRLVRETKSDISSIWAAYMEHCQCSENGSLSTTDEEYTITKKRVDEARQKCIDYIAEIKLNYSTVYYLLKLLDEKAYRDISYTMFSILFGVPNKSFFRAIRKSSEPVKELMLNKSGSIEIYGLRYSKVY